jgi:hypothetical protein
VADRYFLDDPQQPRIVGRAWIMGSQDCQELWKFTLLLPHPVASLSAVDWASLLPPDNVTRWLSFGPWHNRLETEPGAAVSDRS